MIPQDLLTNSLNIELEDLEYRGIITIKLSVEEFGKLLLGESTNCEYIKY